MKHELCAMNDTYTQLWILWIALFGVIEGFSIYDKKKGDTLSEHFWSVIGSERKGYPLPTGYKWRRGVLGAFLTWLMIHLFTGVI